VSTISRSQSDWFLFYSHTQRFVLNSIEIPVAENSHGMEEVEYVFLDECAEVSYAQGRAQNVPKIIGMAENEGTNFAAS